MTSDEKSCLVRFLDMTGDYLRDGYRRERGLYVFMDDPPLPSSLEETASEVEHCTACPLAGGRTRGVPGEGVPEPLVLVVGEGPGADEDATGRPFVGKAGQLLDRILSGIGLSRDRNCFIANVVKCRPPGNRDPLPMEITACLPFLERQIDLLKPLVILALGRVSANILLGDDRGIGKLRGYFTGYRPRNAVSPAIPLLATYHPSALLRDETLKRPVWEDMKLLMGKLEDLDPLYAEAIRDLPVKGSGSRQEAQEG
ncbi:MAG: uracil-DNA glycosylase [Spirochaetaceae bacterium]|jgi:DNA polymerase|nr:uracil-DNA glycosylase [Spirochaetaceae bacterium]